MIKDYKILQLNYPTIDTGGVYHEKPVLDFIDKFNNKTTDYIPGEIWGTGYPWNKVGPDYWQYYAPNFSNYAIKVKNLRVVDNWLIGDIHFLENKYGKQIKDLDRNTYRIYPMMFTKNNGIERTIEGIPYFYILYHHVNFAKLLEHEFEG